MAGDHAVTGPPLARPLASALARMRGITGQHIDLGLDRMQALLGRLGDPHLKLPPTVHIAGTNGKGSTQAFIVSILRAAGWRVGSFTSPYLVRFNEQIRFDGTPIADAALAELVERVCDQAQHVPCTLFELTTAAAFLALGEIDADAVVIEVGLGGRDDATNSIPPPAVSVITQIAFDHMDFLGREISAIAAHKAGILKAGSKAVIGRQSSSEAVDVITAVAQQQGVPVSVAGRDWSTTQITDGFILAEPGRPSRSFPSPSLPGCHQIDNAALAVMACDWLTASTIPVNALREGIASAIWPGRLQRLDHGTLRHLVPAGTTLWLDGGHNDGAAAALAAWLADEPADGPTDLIIGMLESKDPIPFLAALAPHVRSVLTVTIPESAATRAPGHRTARPADELTNLARNAGMRDVATSGTIASAIKDTAAHGSSPKRILIAGSLYLAGAVLELDQPDPVQFDRVSP